MSIELSLGTAKAVIFDLDGTLYNKKGLPLRLIAADVPHMFMLGNERKARKELMGRWCGDEHAYYEALYARVAEMSHSTAYAPPSTPTTDACASASRLWASTARGSTW